MKTQNNLFLFFLLGALIGFTNGLLGGGAGMLCVPFLKRFLKLEDKKAHATSIFITSIISISTLIVYITTLSVDFTYSFPLIFGILIGGIIGTILLKKLSNKTINILFIIVIFVSGFKCLIG